MIVTGHQINFLPGLSVMQKVDVADVVIWMDRMQYVRHGFVNRNRLEDGSWMTIPVNEHDTFAPINEVRIADPDFRRRRKIARRLEMLLEEPEPYVTELLRPWPLLVGLNWALLGPLLADLDVWTPGYLQSMIDVGHAVPVVSDVEANLRPARERIADMVAAIGGTVWLSGPSGSKYLNERSFHERGIEVRYFKPDLPNGNPSAITLLSKTNERIRSCT